MSSQILIEKVWSSLRSDFVHFNSSISCVHIYSDLEMQWERCSEMRFTNIEVRFHISCWWMTEKHDGFASLAFSSLAFILQDKPNTVNLSREKKWTSGWIQERCNQQERMTTSLVNKKNLTSRNWIFPAGFNQVQNCCEHLVLFGAPDTFSETSVVQKVLLYLIIDWKMSLMAQNWQITRVWGRKQGGAVLSKTLDCVS